VNSEGLVKLERIARNLPVPRIEQGRVETRNGTIYLAWGRNADAWHGVWAADIHGGTAQPLEISLEHNDTEITAENVQQILLDTANFDLEVYRGRSPLTA